MLEVMFLFQVRSCAYEQSKLYYCFHYLSTFAYVRAFSPEGKLRIIPSLRQKIKIPIEYLLMYPELGKLISVDFKPNFYLGKFRH